MPQNIEKDTEWRMAYPFSWGIWMPKLVSVLRKQSPVGKNANKLAHPYHRRRLGLIAPEY